MDFPRIQQLPPYVLGVVTQMMTDLRRKGEDVINLGMGNPDLPTPRPIVQKLQEAAEKPKNHRYSVSRGIPKLRLAICRWYERNFGVSLDPDTEAIATMGAKEGFSHLMLAIAGPGSRVAVPDPTYPIHVYAPVIAGAEVVRVPQEGFLKSLESEAAQKRIQTVVVSYPSNPTTAVVEIGFFEQLVSLARQYNFLIVHDLAYADLVFDGYRAPSLLQAKGAREVGVELYTLSKGFSMPGWRVGFVVGNRELVFALTRLKSYLDYGMFTPIQVAATVALDGSHAPVREAVEIYRKRRDALCDGLARIGWCPAKPLATMFVWARIPEKFSRLGSVEFAKRLLVEGRVAVSPGLGFGPCGEGYVRFALVENENRIRQAVRGIKRVLNG